MAIVGEKQIPFGNDNQDQSSKGNSNRKGKSKGGFQE